MKAMQGNRFEKQVQQKMDEFGLAPSSQVWEEVEKRIRREKRKRRIIFWLFFFLLLAGSGITIGTLTGKDKKNNIDSSYSKIEKREPSDLSRSKQTGISTSNESDANDKRSIIVSQKSNVSNEQVMSSSNKPDDKNNLSFVNKKNNENSKREILSVKKEYKVSDLNSQVSIDSKQVAGSSTVDNNKTDETISLNENDKTQKENNTSEEIRKDTTQKIVENTIKDSASDGKPANNKRSVAENKKKRWKLGLTVEGGLSQIVKGLRFVSANSAYTYQSPPSSTGGGISSVNPTPVHSSTAFTAGVFVQHSITKRLDFDLGLTYSLLSTKMKVGNKLDSNNFLNFSSTVNNFYAGSNANNSYTNHYHFLDISADLAWSISKKNSIYWKNRFSYSRLLYSDGLYFDGTYSVYYRDFNQFNKNHFFLSTGFSIPAGKRFNLDMFMKYDLTPLSKNWNFSPAHLSYYGFGINFFPGKKK